ncbi:hypothetical protein ACLB1Q_13055 [Escherichia coli]
MATDDIIDAAEAGVDQTISGQVTGAAAGDTVTITLSRGRTTLPRCRQIKLERRCSGLRATGAGQRRTDHFGFGDEQRGQYR